MKISMAFVLALASATLFTNCAKTVKIDSKRSARNGNGGSTPTTTADLPPEKGTPLSNGAFLPIGDWNSTSDDIDSLEGVYTRISFNGYTVSEKRCRFENDCTTLKTYTISETTHTELGTFLLDDYNQDILMYDFNVSSNSSGAPTRVSLGMGTEYGDSILVYSAAGSGTSKTLYLIQK